MSSPTIHGEFKLQDSKEPSLIYVMPKESSTGGSFTEGSVAAQWFIRYIDDTEKQGNTNSDPVHGVTIEWDFTGEANIPKYIVVIAGYEMPDNMNLVTNVKGQQFQVDCSRSSDPFFYIALANDTQKDPEKDNFKDWPPITIKIDPNAGTFKNEDVKNNPNQWELYYLPSIQELEAGKVLNLTELEKAPNGTFTFKKMGGVSGRYIFGKIGGAISSADSEAATNGTAANSVVAAGKLTNVLDALAHTLTQPEVKHAFMENIKKINGT